ncbi:hypothetical protein F4680DRAFT_409163 [Xylaria scruposa]|nr:hypothetical protein F4680DRAFT_409163 [Xylaria scruposa]
MAYLVQFASINRVSTEQRLTEMSENSNKLSEWDVAENVEATQDAVINSDVTASERMGTLYSQCLASFQGFLARCSRYDDLNSSQGLEKCFEEYSRLKIWGYQKRAALESSVPDSLAAMMHGHSKLEGVLLEIYEQMIDGFQQIDSMSSASLSESMDFLADEYNSDEDSEAGSNVSDKPSIEDDSRFISRIMRCIFDSIDELFRIGSLIRRPQLTGRYLRSNRPILNPICQQDYEHVRQKLLLWQKQQKNEGLQDKAIKTVSHVINPFEEETATPELMANRQSADEKINPKELILSRRLAISNLKRRMQLSYWDTHPYQANSEALKPVDTKSKKPVSEAFTFSTVDRAAIFPDQPNAYRDDIAHTIYTRTQVGKNTALRVPDLPPLDPLEKSFECPYCHMQLSVEEMNTRENWKRHVFRDLRPYICTFPDCLDSERLFLTRHDWIYHEMQLHRRQWICQSCSRQYISKLEMTEHLRRVHNPSIRDRELTSLLEMSERPIDEAHVDNCPFCYGFMSTKKLLKHIAGHMEELALFSLPQSYEDTGETEDPAQSEGLPSSEIPNINSLTAHESHVKGFEKAKSIVVYYCCNCNDGPWTPLMTDHCQSCHHVLCGYCRYELKCLPEGAGQ